MLQKKLLTDLLLEKIELTSKEKLIAVWHLSVPAILAQITSILMQYIDAAMVGELGANASASIGIVSTSTWLLGGLCIVAASGFSVQIAQQIGAGEIDKARTILKVSMIITLMFSILLSFICVFFSSSLPIWLGASSDIQKDASIYFFIYVCSLPAQQLNILFSYALQCSGDMRTPSILNALMCILDIILNLILIRLYGVMGAALGTALSQFIICGFMFWATCIRSPLLKISIFKRFSIDKSLIMNSLHIGFPMAIEHIAVCGAMIVSTKIIAPLGTIAIAANSFAVTAESLCYMPGYGIASAATTLVGQSIGAGKLQLAKSFADLSIILGTIIMGIVGIIMYFLCPYIFQMLTPDLNVQKLSVEVLRIELIAEPLYAVSIIASGALRGAGDTLIPSILNFVSIWGVRLPLSLLSVKHWGLQGVWFAMCVELCIRGLLLLNRQRRGNWLYKIKCK